MDDIKWTSVFIRSLEDINEPAKRSLLYMVLIGIINEYKNGRYDGMDGVEILNSLGIKCKHISASATEGKVKQTKGKTKKNGKTTAV